MGIIKNKKSAIHFCGFDRRLYRVRISVKNACALIYSHPAYLPWALLSIAHFIVSSMD